MPDDDVLRMKARLSKAGMPSRDLSWLAGLDFKPAAIPAIASQAEYDAYARRNAALTAAMDHLTFAEKAAAPESMLAAVLGARMADFRDREEEDEE
jgi:hypothetical protein